MLADADVVYTSALLAGTMKLLDVLPSLKIILYARPSVFKFNLKRTVICLHKNCADCASSLTLNKQIFLRKICFRKIGVDSFNIASNRTYYFRF